MSKKKNNIKSADGTSREFKLIIVCAIVFIILFGFTVVNYRMSYAMSNIEIDREYIDVEYEYDIVDYVAPISMDYADNIGFHRFFHEMPTPVTQRNRNARFHRLDSYLSFHMCWCWGLQIVDYDSTMDVNGLEHSGFYIFQDQDTRNLVITDKEEFIAIYDYSSGVASTLSYEGTRSYRSNDFSIYFYSDGLGVIVQDGPNQVVYFKRDWVYDSSLFDSDILTITLDEILRMDHEFMQLIGYIFIRYSKFF